MTGPSVAPAATTADRNLALLRAVVKEDVAALDRALQGPDPDLPAFLDFADQHRLLGYVYRALQRLGSLGTLPPRSRERAKLAYLRQWQKNERLARELARLSELFERQGVDVLWLKGPLLAQRFHGDVGARSIADLDVLVKGGRDLEHVERLLLADGYARAYGLLFGRRLSRAFTHHFSYRSGDVVVEVHWVLQRHFTFGIDYARVWRDAVQMSFRGRACRATSDEYELVLQILSALTDLQVGTLLLKPFIDMYKIVRILEQDGDWDGFFARRRREGLFTCSAYFLGLLLDTLDCAGELPTLAACLCETNVYSPPGNAEGLQYALHGGRLDARQKLAALRLYQTSLGAALAWWALSLPFRLAVYQEDRGNLFRRA